MDADRVNKLKAIYYDVANPSAFTSAVNLWKAGRRSIPDLKFREVETWLRGEGVYTRHKPKRRHFVRNPVVVSAVDELWQADLVDMQQFKRVNNGSAYLLTVIDVMSKYAFAIPVKTKHGTAIAKAFESIFQQRYPSSLQTDQGKEFLNKDVQSLLSEWQVHFYATTDADVKCSLVERFNRTLRWRMFKYFDHKGSYKYVDVVAAIVNGYNKTIHSVTRMRPIDVTDSDSAVLFERLYGFKSRREMMLEARNLERDVVPVGSSVRIKFQENSMDKGYYPTWTDEIFTVSKSIKDTYNKPMYILTDEDGEVIKGRFYPEEIQVITDESYRVTVLRSRTRRGVKEHFVHWIGYPSSKDCWIKDSDIVSSHGLSINSNNVT